MQASYTCSEYFILPEGHTHAGQITEHHRSVRLNGYKTNRSRAALTLLLEGEVLCEVPALMVPTQEEECGGVVDLKRPEVENTLGGDTGRDTGREKGGKVRYNYNL